MALLIKVIYKVTFFLVYRWLLFKDLFTAKRPTVSHNDLYKIDMGGETITVKKRPKLAQTKWEGVKVFDFPNMELLKGDYYKHYSPFDQLYYIVFGNILLTGYDVDCRKVFINAEDGKHLFNAYKEFIRLYNQRDSSDSLTVKAWEKKGPIIATGVPRGLIFAREGYAVYR